MLNNLPLGGEGGLISHLQIWPENEFERDENKDEDSGLEGPNDTTNVKNK